MCCPFQLIIIIIVQNAPSVAMLNLTTGCAFFETELRKCIRNPRLAVWRVYVVRFSP